jgi:hypothetical protein
MLFVACADHPRTGWPLNGGYIGLRDKCPAVNEIYALWIQHIGLFQAFTRLPSSCAFVGNFEDVWTHVQNHRIWVEF